MMLSSAADAKLLELGNWLMKINLIAMKRKWPGGETEWTLAEQQEFRILAVPLMQHLNMSRRAVQEAALKRVAVATSADGAESQPEFQGRLQKEAS